MWCNCNDIEIQFHPDCVVCVCVCVMCVARINNLIGVTWQIKIQTHHRPASHSFHCSHTEIASSPAFSVQCSALVSHGSVTVILTLNSVRAVSQWAAWIIHDAMPKIQSQNESVNGFYIALFISHTESESAERSEVSFPLSVHSSYSLLLPCRRVLSLFLYTQFRILHVCSALNTA